jgi:hypothetical protein
MQSREKRRRR